MLVIDRQRELFKQENVWHHIVCIAIDYIGPKNIKMLPCSSKLPDLNPIDHIRVNQLDKQVQHCQLLPRTHILDQLRQKMQQELQATPLNNI